jgi:FkbM family methyltransferase
MYNSQIGQDKWIIAATDGKKNGYFVEFGACDGVYLSNTFVLESSYEWNGILAEPAKIYHEKLKNNRNCNIDFSCIYSESDKEIEFLETPDPVLSIIKGMNPYDYFHSHRENPLLHYPNDAKTYTVKTLTLEDLLKKYNAPKYIDYLSIDTEGSEFEILKNFDFSKYYIKYITVEHNFTLTRELIYDLLFKNGFVKSEINANHDDWYVNINEFKEE